MLKLKNLVLSRDGKAARSERVVRQLIRYVCSHRKYLQRAHITQVLSWLGFIAKGIEFVAEDGIHRHYQRQVKFAFRRRHFKVRFKHGGIGVGGLEIVESIGKQDGETITVIRNLDEAENVYLTLQKKLEHHITKKGYGTLFE